LRESASPPNREKGVGLVGFFDWINRWQVVVAVVLIVAGFNFGFYLGLQLFSH
jgi:hypothetical protein